MSEQERNGIEEQVEAAGQEAQEQPADELAAARAQAEEYLRNWQRTQADFINFKRRTQQERAELERLANAELIRRILPVLDDFDRAVAALPEEERESESGWATGVLQIVRKLHDTLGQQGLAPVEAVGQEFDPNVHEAVLQVAAPPEMAGKVTAEMRRGYKLHDRVIRPAMVVVGREADEGSAGPQ